MTDEPSGEPRLEKYGRVLGLFEAYDFPDQGNPANDDEARWYLHHRRPR